LDNSFYFYLPGGLSTEMQKDPWFVLLSTNFNSVDCYSWWQKFTSLTTTDMQSCGIPSNWTWLVHMFVCKQVVSANQLHAQSGL